MERAGPPRGFHERCGGSHARAGSGGQTVSHTTYGVISIQLRAVAEDLVGKAIQVLDIVGEPWNWKKGTWKIDAFALQPSLQHSKKQEPQKALLKNPL